VVQGNLVVIQKEELRVRGKARRGKALGGHSREASGAMATKGRELFVVRAQEKGSYSANSGGRIEILKREEESQTAAGRSKKSSKRVQPLSVHGVTERKSRLSPAEGRRRGKRKRKGLEMSYDV